MEPAPPVEKPRPSVPSADGKPTAPEWVCGRLDVQAHTRDQDGQGWGYLLTFADPVGKAKSDHINPIGELWPKEIAFTHSGELHADEYK